MPGPDVDTEALELIHPLQQAPIYGEGVEAPLLLPAKEHNQLLGLANIQLEVVHPL